MEQLAAADALAESGDTEKAITTYRYVANHYPRSDEAPKAQFKLAKQLKNKGDFSGAFKEYQALLKKYPQTPNFEESVSEQIDIANAYLKGLKVKFFGIPLVSSMEKAEEMYMSILQVSPYSKYAPITQFNLGLSMEKQGKTKEAIDAYQKVLDKYPNSPACSSASYQIGYVYQRLGMTGKSQDLSALKSAQDNYQDFLLQYPNSEKVPLRIGQERPETGERLAERRRLQAQVESTALANYDGPPKKEIVGEELPLPQPQMKGDIRDAQPIPLQEPPSQTPVQKTPLAP